MEKLALKAADAEEEMEKLGVKENEHSVIKKRRETGKPVNKPKTEIN